MAQFIPRLDRYVCGSIEGDILGLDWYIYLYQNVRHNFPLPNCTVYAYGRTLEQYKQLGEPIENRTSPYNPWWWNSAGSHYPNAENWFDYVTNVWQKGSVAKLGAIACWENSVGGHVAIVEKINDDGSVDLSESHYGGAVFNYARNQHLVVGQHDSRIGGKFQGYIYNTINYDGGGNNDLIIYRRGRKVKIISTGRASSTGRLPIAYGIGWIRDILKVYKNREYPIQVGDIKSGKTTGFYKENALQIIK